MKYYLQLARPANLVTAISDILAGMAIAGCGLIFLKDHLLTLVLLSVSTVGLYGGGVVFNDLFDAELDAIERPERAIPSGKISKQNAFIYGSLLILIGIISATYLSFNSGIIATIVAFLAVFYDKYGKHNDLFGPINMGLCRGGNLLLGMSADFSKLEHFWWIGFVPVIYIAAITMVSRGEVHGGNSKILKFALFLYMLVSAVQLYIAHQNSFLMLAVPIVLLHLILTIRPLINAIQNPIGPNIGKAVKAGVISLIVMNAAWIAAFGDWELAFVTLLLLPLSIQLAKIFAVT